MKRTFKDSVLEVIDLLPEDGMKAKEIESRLGWSTSQVFNVRRKLIEILGLDIISNSKLKISDKDIAKELVTDYFDSSNDRKSCRGVKKGTVQVTTWKNIYQVVAILDSYKSGLKLTDLYEKYKRITLKTLTPQLLDKFNSLLSENLIGLDYFSRGRVRLSSDTTLLQVKSILLDKYNINVDDIKESSNVTVEKLSQSAVRMTESERVELRVNMATILYLTKTPLSIDEVRKSYFLRYDKQISEITAMSVIDEFVVTIPDLIEVKGSKYQIREFNEVMKVIKPELSQVNLVIRVPNHLDIQELDGMENGIKEVAEELSDSVIYEVSTQNSSEFWKSMIKLYYKGAKILSPSSYRKKVEDIIWKTLDNINTVL